MKRAVAAAVNPFTFDGVVTKLFQIEEPDGSPLDPSGPGAAVGIAVVKAGRSLPGHSLQGAVAIAVGGNAEILPSTDGERVLDSGDLAELLLGLRSRAEKQLSRPVTHAVVMAPPIEEGPLALAAAGASLVLLDTVDSGTKSVEAAALEAAVLAEDLAAKDLAPKN
jgi:hypothetical protein